MPTICTVSGIVLQPSGVGFTGVVVIATLDRPFIYPSTGQVIPNFQQTTTTAGDGSWSMPLVETATAGLSMTFAFQYSQAAGSTPQRYEYTATIPNASSASFSDIINTSSDGEGFVAPAVPGYATLADLPTTAENGFLARVLSSPASLYEYDLATTTWNLVGPGGGSSSGITSINADTTAAQTIVTGSAGSDFAITTTGGVTTIGIPNASVSARGLLTAADWFTFNAKQNSIISANLTAAGTDGIAITGGTGSMLSAASIAQSKATSSQNGYLASADFTTFSAKGSGTVTAISVASANGLAGTSSGGATPILTLTTTITGILQSNGAGISAATTTGTGSLVQSVSPTLTTPNLGTPSAVALTNGTSLPIVGGTSGTLTVARGGTGATTLTAHGVLLGEGSSTISATSVGSVGQVLTGVSSADPTFQTLPGNTTILAVPKITRETTVGSGTFTTNTSPPTLYMRVTVVGAGAGGNGSGTGLSGGMGGTGGTSSFGTSLLSATGGTATNTTTGALGAGGIPTVTSPAITKRLVTGAQGSNAVSIGSLGVAGAIGASSPLAGAGGGSNAVQAGSSAVANTGSGGGGAGNSSITGFAGGSGSAGGYLEAIVVTPTTTYAFVVGAAGTAGTAGTSGFAGGIGGSGYVEIIEYFQ